VAPRVVPGGWKGLWVPAEKGGAFFFIFAFGEEKGDFKENIGAKSGVVKYFV